MKSGNVVFIYSVFLSFSHTTNGSLTDSELVSAGVNATWSFGTCQSKRWKSEKKNEIEIIETTTEENGQRPVHSMRRRWQQQQQQQQQWRCSFISTFCL